MWSTYFLIIVDYGAQYIDECNMAVRVLRPEMVFSICIAAVTTMDITFGPP